MSPSQNKAAMQDHIPQRQASRLTQAEYCKVHNIKPYIFSYYKNKLAVCEIQWVIKLHFPTEKVNHIDKVVNIAITPSASFG
ncbi:MAG: hypothetical protein ABGX71_07530 [Methyloprofundus sp.]|uniref:IS66 family insertion sequence element accessory protein TnpA n=1 Tax=Methyloprofundus sp. TaxID=2020875 RepID=UPI00261ED092|nr:hypothetical protein [Methyloprofundus sp.]